MSPVTTMNYKQAVFMHQYPIARRTEFYRKMLFLPFILKQVIDHAFELSKGICRGFANDRHGPRPSQQQ
jgi:hypothetical protein